MSMQASDSASSEKLTLKLPVTAGERILDAVALLGLMTNFIVLAAYWSRLPNIVPTHFSISGKPDGWNSKWYLLIAPGVSLVLFIGMTVIPRIRHRLNFPWGLTEANAERQYRLSRQLLGILKSVVTWLFAFLTWSTARVALGSEDGMRGAFTPVLVAAICLPVLIYLIRSFRAR